MDLINTRAKAASTIWRERGKRESCPPNETWIAVKAIIIGTDLWMCKQWKPNVCRSCKGTSVLNDPYHRSYAAPMSKVSFLRMMYPMLMQSFTFLNS